MIDKLTQWSYLAFDTETTGLNVRKDKVSGFSVCGEPGMSFYYPLYAWDKKINELVPMYQNREYVGEILDILKTKELLTWNGSFDIRIVKNNLGVDLTEQLIADGMLLKHTLQEDGPFGLKPSGIELQSKIGLNVEEEANKEQIELKENIKQNGGAITKNNFEMYKADLEVLGRYACSDADLTLRICEYYLQQLEKEGLSEFFFDLEVMPLYKTVTIPMEDKGVFLDLALITTLQGQITVDIEKLESQIEQELFCIPEVQEYINQQVLSYCDAKPTGTFAQEYITYFGLKCETSPKTGKYLLSKLEVKPGSNHEAFFAGTLELEEGLEFDIKKAIYLKAEGKLLNIFSKKQMSTLAFDYLGYKPLSTTAGGAPQFNDDFIQSLVAEDVYWAKLLSDYNKLIKIKGSYIDRFLEGHENGYYFFSYKQHGTISGRYGSDAQQLPRPLEEGSEVVLKYNNQIRKFFISEAGRRFIDCDYESLEPKIFSHVSGDANLQAIFKKGEDFYSRIAIDTEGLYEYSADKKAENYLGKVNKAKRTSAKAYSLGIPYGLGGYALGKTLDIPTDEAEILVEGYLTAYPDLKKWMDRSKEQAQLAGFVTSELGRIRHLPKVKDIYKRYGDKLLDMKFRNKLGTRIPKEVVMGMYLDYKNGVNNSRNFQIQSMAASIVNRAAIMINSEFKRLNIDGYVCAQIHDQLIMDVALRQAEEASKVVQRCMENVVQLTVDLSAPPVLATNWRDGH
jgi:DNA polymerase I-like protein with 3'-5' exonuclease and polymerase domains